MNTVEMDLHRNEYPMTRQSEQPYACHDTQRAWLAYQAGADKARIGGKKKILVLGSAPGAFLPHDIENYFVIAANASIGAFPELVPDTLVLNGCTLQGEKGIAPKSQEVLAGRRVRHLIVIDNVPGIDSLIKKSGIIYQSLEIWSPYKRADVCSYRSGISYAGTRGNDITSTGVTALCYALGFPADVFVSGINTGADGHSYSDQVFTRGHVDVDRKTLAALSGGYKEFVR